ncbi:MAG: sugar nucleotide-binding protein [Candidatus Shapirobacteria bacterium]
MTLKPKIIGTGLSGLVGSRVVELLQDRLEFVDFSLETGINLLDQQNLSTAFSSHQDATAILHLAAFTDTGAAWLQRGDKSAPCYQVNVIGVQNLLELAKKYHKYFINISTDFVFDGTTDGKYTEESTPNPIEWYGQTKYEAEKLVSASGVSFSTVRLAFPYRAKFEPKKDLIRKLIDNFKSGNLYPMFTDQITTPTFIDDIALALGYILDNQPNGIFHVVGSSSQSPYQMAQMIADTFDFDKLLVKEGSLVDFVASQPPDSRPWQKNLSLSNKKISDLGIKMKTLSEGLQTLKTQL